VEITTISDLLEYLRKHKDLLHERFGVTRMGVFGSFAEGLQSLSSDVDMVVEFESGRKNIHSFLQLKRFLEGELSREVDLGFEHALKARVRESLEGKIIYV